MLVVMGKTIYVLELGWRGRASGGGEEVWWFGGEGSLVGGWGLGSSSGRVIVVRRLGREGEVGVGEWVEMEMEMVGMLR